MSGIKTKPWDSSEYLAEPEAQADLLADAVDSGHAPYIAHALGTIARARGMTEIARAAGVSRESLYKSLSAEGNPELATVLAVAKALNLKLKFEVDGERAAA